MTVIYYTRKVTDSVQVISSGVKILWTDCTKHFISYEILFYYFCWGM